jgi:hypothetical protein
MPGHSPGGCQIPPSDSATYMFLLRSSRPPKKVQAKYFVTLSVFLWDRFLYPTSRLGFLLQFFFLWTHVC